MADAAENVGHPTDGLLRGETVAMFRTATSPISDSIQGPLPVSPGQSVSALSKNEPNQRIKNILWTVVFATLLLAGLAAYGVTRFGSFSALFAALRGRILYAEQVRISVGILKPREQVAVRVHLRNLASRPIRLLGSHSSCGCLVAKKLPMELAAGEVQEVSIQLTAPAYGPGEFENIVTFYTNVAGEQLLVKLYGRVLPSDAGNDGPRKPG